jgi:hypothetical protein
MINCAISLTGRRSTVTVTHTVKRKRCEDSEYSYLQGTTFKRHWDLWHPMSGSGIELGSRPIKLIHHRLRWREHSTAGGLSWHRSSHDGPCTDGRNDTTCEELETHGRFGIACHISKIDYPRFGRVTDSARLQAWRRTVLAGISRVGSIQVNKSVRLSRPRWLVTNVSPQRVSFAFVQEFPKSTKKLDAFMPPSRRNNDFAKSNKCGTWGHQQNITRSGVVSDD